MSQYSPPPAEPKTRGAATVLRNKFLAGLVFAIPLVATFAILSWIYLWVQKLSAPLIERGVKVLNRLPWIDGQIPVAPEPFPMWAQAIGVLAVVAIVVMILVALGMMVTNVVGRRMVAGLDQLLSRIPVVSFIYKSLKQAIHAFQDMGSGDKKFQRVVYVEYPGHGARMLGFVTGGSYDGKREVDLIHVFIPTSPNPMTGFLLLIEAKNIEDAPLSIEEAMKMVLSAGLVSPDVLGG